MTSSCSRNLPLCNLKKLALATALLASFTTPAHAFLTELVVGLTSVTNNLIDSTESVTNNTVNTASTTMLSLSSNPGKMADRIGVMADRIVTTEGIMAGLAHKIIDRTTEPRVVQQYASAYAPTPIPAQQATVGYRNPYANTYGQVQQQAVPGGNPYMAGKPAPAVAHYGYATPPDNSRYSASNMIYGVTGDTYTAAHPTAVAQAQAASPSSYGFANMSAVNTSGKMCTSYGVKRSC
jgi:hypothetical protein